MDKHTVEVDITKSDTTSLQLFERLGSVEIPDHGAGDIVRSIDGTWFSVRLNGVGYEFSVMNLLNSTTELVHAELDRTSEETPDVEAD